MRGAFAGVATAAVTYLGGWQGRCSEQQAAQHPRLQAGHVLGLCKRATRRPSIAAAAGREDQAAVLLWRVGGAALRNQRPCLQQHGT